MESRRYNGLSPEDKRFIREELPKAIVDAECRQVSMAFKTMVARVMAVATSLLCVSVFMDALGPILGILLFSAAMGGFFYVDRRLMKRAAYEAKNAHAFDSMEYKDFDVTPTDRDRSRPRWLGRHKA